MNDHTPYNGRCLCGAIRYEVKKLEPKMGHCHCSMCRKFHGAAFATFGEAKTENFSWTKGEENLQSFVAQNGTTRRFCKNCGSSMTFAVAEDDGSLVEFALGTLDSNIPQKADVHIYTANRAQWFEIEDDLPQFPEGRAT